MITYGGITTQLWVPEKDGKFADVVLVHDSLKCYLAGHPFFGAIAGRYANRIAKGKFTLDGKEYTLAVNNRPNHLHGGNKGFDKVVWQAEPAQTKDGQSLRLSYLSKDGEEGDPAKPAMCARLRDPRSGRVMEVTTSQPGVQLYTGIHLDGKTKGIGRVPYQKAAGVCLETQHFPDSPNHPEFPSTTLRPGQTYDEVTVLRFSAE